MTLGTFTIFFSLILIVLQLIILRKNFRLEHILQIPVSILFGYFIDLTMLLLNGIELDTYIFKIIFLVIGCVILGFGVYLEMLSNVVMLPGESFVRAVFSTIHPEFGVTKVVFDVSMSVIAAVLSFIFAKHLQCVREGTIIAAVLVGFIARIFFKDFLLCRAASVLFKKRIRKKETLLIYNLFKIFSRFFCGCFSFYMYFWVLVHIL